MPEEIPEWENLPEETPPEKLQRKWVKRDYFEKKTVVCPSCQNEVPADNLNCLFCGERVCEDSGLLGKLLAGFKNLFRSPKRR